MRVTKTSKIIKPSPRNVHKLISYNQAIEELRSCYNVSIEKIKKHLDKGTQLGNGLGTFYQITQERR